MTARAFGFTLVELIAVAAIISILAGITLLVVRGAMHDSNVARTRSTIQKINEVLRFKWEAYITQPLPMRLPSAALERDAQSGRRALSAREMARVRLLALRDLMRLEMPDRPGDLLSAPVPIKIGLNERLVGNNPPHPEASNSVITSIPLPATARSMFVKVNNVPGWSEQFANEELLFMVIEQQSINGSSALEQFQSNEIGDVDQDGLREFLDAWGTPIRWLRWPAGYDNINAYVSEDGMSVGGTENLDPLDPLLADWGLDPIIVRQAGQQYTPGHGLFPLVISAGADKEFGVQFDMADGVQSVAQISSAVSWLRFLPSAYFQGGPYFYPDPYFPREQSIAVKLGATIDRDIAADNVSNFDDDGA